jgi:membrane fusion protein (multidrug efflux system)
MNRPALETTEARTRTQEALVEMKAIPVRTSKRRGWFLALGSVALVVLALAGIKATQVGAMIKSAKSFTPPPEMVTSAKAEAVQWQASRSAAATLIALRAVTVASELPGQVREISFDSGAFVRRGQPLVKLDTSTEEAQLDAAEADAALAKVTLSRTRVLRLQNTSTPADLDAAEARARQTAANVSMLRTAIAKKIIRAPFDGRIAIRQVELGQVLAAGAAIASLQSVHPLHADFWLPQQVLADLRAGMQARLTTDVFPGRTWEGAVTVVNPEVDPATRNVRVRATFANADGLLRPGMFGNVEVLSPDERPALVIPATAVVYAPYGDSVFAIEKKDKQLVAEQKFVRLGERRGDLVTVVSGLEAGETLVSSGAFKLHSGSTLTLRNGLAPTAELAPRPREDK